MIAIIYVGDHIAGHLSPTVPFNSKVWRQSVPGPPGPNSCTPRWDMKDALIKSRLLLGRTKPKIRKVLGPPDFQYSNGTVWNYNMGVCNDFIAIDSAIFEVSFKNGKVTAVGWYEN